MNLRHLVFFKELARTQHMAKAAENLAFVELCHQKTRTRIGCSTF